MDPFEILGSILGQKAGGSGTGADILKDIFMGGARRQAPSRSEPESSSQPAGDDIERQARELEDLLNVAKDRSSGGATPQSQSQQQAPWGQSRPVEDDVSRQNEQASILIRAM